MNKPGILLEVVQILSDLDLIITKAYISSDGGWFMDGMNVFVHFFHQKALKRTLRSYFEALNLVRNNKFVAT